MKDVCEPQPPDPAWDLARIELFPLVLWVFGANSLLLCSRRMHWLQCGRRRSRSRNTGRFVAVRSVRDDQGDEVVLGLVAVARVIDGVFGDSFRSGTGAQLLQRERCELCLQRGRCSSSSALLRDDQGDEIFLGLVAVARAFDGVFADAEICSAFAQVFDAECLQLRHLHALFVTGRVPKSKTRQEGWERAPERHCCRCRFVSSLRPTALLTSAFFECQAPGYSYMYPMGFRCWHLILSRYG